MKILANLIMQKVKQRSNPLLPYSGTVADTNEETLVKEAQGMHINVGWLECTMSPVGSWDIWCRAGDTVSAGWGT